MQAIVAFCIFSVSHGPQTISPAMERLMRRPASLSEAALLRFGELGLFQSQHNDLIRLSVSCRSCTHG